MEIWNSAPTMPRQLGWAQVGAVERTAMRGGKPSRQGSAVARTQALQVGKGPDFGRDRRQLALAQVQPLQPLHSCATRSGTNETKSASQLEQGSCVGWRLPNSCVPCVERTQPATPSASPNPPAAG